MAEAEDDLGRPLRGVVEVEWDGWDTEPRRSRALWVGVALLLLAVVAVAGLVWWAMGSDAELPPDTTTTTEVAPAG